MDSFNPQRIAVTGAGGFIGRALVSHLEGLGKQVVAISRTPVHASPGIATSQVRDYGDAAELARAIEGCDAVVHLAALAHLNAPAEAFEGNVRAAQAIAKASRAAGIARLIFMSSIGVNGNLTHDRPFTESETPRPAEPYAMSKLRSERAVIDTLASSSTAWTILRPPLVIGPGAPGNFAKLLHAVERGWILPVAAIRNARNLLARANLLQIVALCLHHPAAANELFLAADDEAVSTPDMVRHIAKGLGKPARMVPVPPALLRAGARLAGRAKWADSVCGSLRVDASKARSILGWKPVQRSAEAIEEAARWSIGR